MAEETRFAVLYSDGSMGILPSGGTIEYARQQALDSDVNEHQPENFTRVALVKLTIGAEIETPSLVRAGPKACPSCGRPHPKKAGGAHG